MFSSPYLKKHNKRYNRLSNQKPRITKEAKTTDHRSFFNSPYGGKSEKTQDNTKKRYRKGWDAFPIDLKK
jgi:hypothetical protein